MNHIDIGCNEGRNSEASRLATIACYRRMWEAIRTKRGAVILLCVAALANVITNN